MTWSEEKIATTLSRQIFQNKCLVVVPNCSWTGYECDLLAVTKDLRVIDVEVKISRSDYRADARKDKWFEQWAGSWRTPMHQRAATPRQWPAKVWKHYYAMPKAIWKPEMADWRPSKNSGVILLNPVGEKLFASVEIRATPCRDAERLSAADAVDIARLASLRMWDTYDKLREARKSLQTLRPA